MPRCTPLLAVLFVVGACARSPRDLDVPVGISTTTGLRTAGPAADAAPPSPSSECILPVFEFDAGSAVVDPAQDVELHRIARCLAVGPLRRDRLVVIGHADERGPAAENLDLALDRASKVREFLVAHGAPEERVLATAASTQAFPGRRVDFVLVVTPRE